MKLKISIIAATIFAALITTAAQAGETIRLGRDVFIDTPIAQSTAPRPHSAIVPQTYRQPINTQQPRFIHTSRHQPYGQNAAGQAASRITNSAINTATYEVSRGINQAIRQQFRRINY